MLFNFGMWKIHRAFLGRKGASRGFAQPLTWEGPVTDFPIAPEETLDFDLWRIFDVSR